MVKRVTVIVFFVLMLGFISCGGPSKYYEITAESYFKDHLIAIPLKIMRYYDGYDGMTSFDNNISIEEIGEKLDDAFNSKELDPEYQDQNLAYTLYDKCILIECTPNRGTTYYAIVQNELKTDSRKVYYFCGLEAPFGPEEIRNTQLFTFLFPVHLLSDCTNFSVDASNFVNKLNTPYEINVGKEELLNFYNSVNKFETTETDDGFIVENYKQEIPEIERKVYPKLDYAVRFSFVSVEGNNYVTISVVS